MDAAGDTRQPPLRAVRRDLAVAAALVALLAAVQLLPAPWQQSLRYERASVAAGEWYRLASANLVHLGWGHLLLNAAGLGVVVALTGAGRTAAWLGALALAGVVASLGVHLFAPDVFWMVGLSGALHGLLVAGAIAWLVRGDRLGAVLLAGIAFKIGFEQLIGEVPLTGDIVGGNVVTAAHLWGAVGGVVAGVLEGLRWRAGAASL